MPALMNTTAGVRAPLACRNMRTRRAAAVCRAAAQPAVSPNSDAVKLANSVGLFGLEVRGARTR